MIRLGTLLLTRFLRFKNGRLCLSWVILQNYLELVLKVASRRLGRATFVQFVSNSLHVSDVIDGNLDHCMRLERRESLTSSIDSESVLGESAPAANKRVTDHTRFVLI